MLALMFRISGLALTKWDTFDDVMSGSRLLRVRIPDKDALSVLLKFTTSKHANMLLSVVLITHQWHNLRHTLP